MSSELARVIKEVFEGSHPTWSDNRFSTDIFDENDELQKAKSNYHAILDLLEAQNFDNVHLPLVRDLSAAAATYRAKALKIFNNLNAYKSFAHKFEDIIRK